MKIDKNIPIPKYRKTRLCKYPFRDMEIGDSFLFVPTEQDILGYAQARVLQVARNHKPKKFITQREHDGIRVWRIE